MQNGRANRPPARLPWLCRLALILAREALRSFNSDRPPRSDVSGGRGRADAKGGRRERVEMRIIYLAQQPRGPLPADTASELLRRGMVVVTIILDGVDVEGRWRERTSRH